ncbi:MAG TPA: transketolase [Anaerolineae bacterium]|nr:transketolase [Anaerolineae bacterium]
MNQTELDQLCVNTIRALSIDSIQKANSGHPGLPLGAAPVGYVLFTRMMRHNPADPKWINRDRFVLSGGHGSMLLYTLLHMTGYDLPLSELQSFRQWGSLTPGHPEVDVAPGVETTTGPLGQGFTNGVGMALAEAHLAARYNRPGYNIVDHFTYGIVTDGDVMEGVASEAASLAGHWKLGRLIYLYDDNRISLAGSTNITFSEDVGRRFEAYGWHVHRVENGNDLSAIGGAIRDAQMQIDRPSLIRVRSVIGYGSPNKQNTFEVHGSPLGPEEVKLTKQNLGWPLDPPFYIPGEALEHFRAALDRGKALQAEWQQKWDGYARAYPDLAAELRRAISGELPDGWDADVPSFGADTSAGKSMATRVASGQVLNAIAARLPTLVGGSADLNPSTNTALKGMGDFMHPATPLDGAQGLVGGGVSYAGRNVAFGVREHAMAGIASGMALHGGVLPFVATFLQFSDYMRPAIRLAALMERRVIYVFTHDSVLLGEDGPTHQPVEHFSALRAIPKLLFIRPGDPSETAVAWKVAVEHKHGPVALALTRQAVPALDRSKLASAEGLRQGGYILIDTQGKPDIILIGTGSELALCVSAAEQLAQRGVKARVVSLPCWELFDAQPQPYRDSVLPPDVRKRLAVEMGVAQGWHKYVSEHGDVLSLERFGVSAPYTVIAEKFGFTVENVVERAMRLVNE